MMGTPVLITAETLSQIPENPEIQVEEKIEEDKLLQPDESTLSEEINSNWVEWRGEELVNFPLMIGYRGELLRPELIPEELRFVTSSNSTLPANVHWVMNGAPVSSQSNVAAGVTYSIPDIVVEGEERLIDMSIMPQRIEIANGATGALYRINGRARWSAAQVNRSGTVEGQVTARYSDDGSDVSGYILLPITVDSGTHYIKKEDVKGIIYDQRHYLGMPTGVIRDLGDEYMLEAGSETGIFAAVIKPTYQVRWQATANTSYTFWPHLPSELEIWNPAFSGAELRGLQEDQKFISKYELTQEVPTLASGEYRVTLKDDLEIFSTPILTVINEDGGGVDAGNLVENEQGQTEIVFSSQEIAGFRGETVKILLEYPLVTANQSDLIDYLDDDGYVSVPLTAKSNRMSEEVSATAKTWARPWGEAVHQEIGLGTSTSELDPAVFVTALENKLEGDEPFVVDFDEERTFDALGDTTIGVVIESAISGIQNTIDVPVTVVENKGTVFVHHVDTEGNTLADSDELIGKIGEAYETQPQEIRNYQVIETPENATGVYSEEDIDVTYIYDIAPVLPVDPLDPDTETTPENGPTIPEGQGLVSLDFVSQFNFGEVAIHAGAKQYEAQPQRITNGSDNHERPNYVQVSDRREADDRGGWSLMARLSDEGFRNEANEELRGASIHLANQELAKPSANTGVTPQIVRNNGADLLPGVATRLLDANASEGQGTWVYRFGDQDSAGSSVKLDVPSGANPKATSYQATINWELMVVPGND